MSKYENLTVNQIKSLLRARNARLAGRKTELIERLEAYDRNQNFGAGVDTICDTSDWKMETPDAALYKDVISSSVIPSVTHEAVEAYLQPLGTSVTKSAKHLYRERFLRSVRSANHGLSVFIRGQCRAEMKRHISYFVDLDFDNRGLIHTTQCECAAGMGPTAHCKHVQAIMLALIHHTDSSEMVTEVTCTAQIQSFHKPKTLHTGSPVKSNELCLSRQCDSLLFDPEPADCQESSVCFNDRVNNYSVNHAALSGHRMPMLQLIPPANIYAINHDHDYLEKTLADNFLENICVTKITCDVIESIEMSTRGQSCNKKWLKERTKRIQSSNFGRILKATDRTDKDKLTKSLLQINMVTAAPLEHGRKFEPVAIAAFEKETGLVVSKSGIVVDFNAPYLACSPDGIIDSDRLVEVKCPYVAREKPITSVTVPYLKQGIDGLSLDKEHIYMYQIQGQLTITNRKLCYLVVFTHVDMKIILVKRDDAFIATMRRDLDSFFNDCFKPALLNKRFYKNYYQYTWL